MLDYSFDYPEGFSEYEWEVTAKGYFSEMRFTLSGKSYRLNFYDPVRLSQEIESELERGGPFLEPNVVVIRSVTRLNMERAVEQLVESAKVASLLPE